MKDKTVGVLIADFARLKSKMYSYIKGNNIGNKKANIINKNIQNQMTHGDYKSTLFEKK